MNVVSAIVEKNKVLEARVQELLEHNNQQLFENRDQRQQIASLKAQVAKLLEIIGSKAAEAV